MWKMQNERCIELCFGKYALKDWDECFQIVERWDGCGAVLAQ